MVSLCGASGKAFDLREEKVRGESVRASLEVPFLLRVLLSQSFYVTVT